jgi:hypothetical protein
VEPRFEFRLRLKLRSVYIGSNILPGSPERVKGPQARHCLDLLQSWRYPNRPHPPLPLR